ncbi:MAG: SLC26A/SulP transporter family protein [Myxococcales bacterium]|nr:SLC26A/SulP transporter family protein [Myxococcales bacterium]
MLVGDVWGGIAATLVALPASLAFGVAVFGPLVGAGAGALAGLLGATALGTVAPLAGGTPKLVSAPCAPAVAVMSAFALETSARYPGEPARVVLLMTLVGLFAAGLQIALGLARAGSIIKYIPYPVVTGYLSGVAVVIFLKQLPSLLGLAKGVKLGAGLLHPGMWAWPALVVGGTTIALMFLAPRMTKAVPGAIVGLAGGVLAYGALALLLPGLRSLTGNTLVIGPLGGSIASFGEAFSTRVAALGGLHVTDVTHVLGPAATLAVVLSLDTLKTCVVVDSLTGSRHESNRELFGQGLANLASSVIGGMPGAGTSGATLVNIASGGQTRRSAVIEGALVLVAFLSLGGVVAWAPLAALSGILIVVAWRMFDFGALRWAASRSTFFDFVVVLAVIAVAVFVDLITASGVGVALSILLFIRNESRAPVIRRKLSGTQISSKKRRLPDHAAVLAAHGEETLVIELAGSLFFGTTDQLRTELQGDLESRQTFIVDMRRVDAVDLTAVHILEQMRAQVGKRGATMLFCHLPRALAGHKDAEQYLREVGLIEQGHEHLFEQLSDALAWAEDRILAKHGPPPASEAALDLLAMPMFQGRKAETIKELAECVESRRALAGDVVFRHGDSGDEIYFVRRGSVRIALPLEGGTLHVASFGRGDFFGEITFLDGGQRSADATAEVDTELFVISRKRFDVVAAVHPRLGQSLFAGLARATALRLRQADREITTLEEA